MTLLEQLPARVDALALQVSQLRDEMRSEFSAVRGDLQTGDNVTLLTLRDEIRAGDEETRSVLRDEIRVGDEETRRVLRNEIRAGDERVMAQARVLHEDVVSRLALIQEGTRPRADTRGRRKKG